MAQESWSVRKINVGRITGLSSYELAVKHGFEGTEEDYVNKEQKIYNDMVDLFAKADSFSKISCNGKEIFAGDNRTLTITTDKYVDVEIEPVKNTLHIKLSDQFLDSIVYIK